MLYVYSHAKHSNTYEILKGSYQAVIPALFILNIQDEWVIACLSRHRSNHIMFRSNLYILKRLMIKDKIMSITCLFFKKNNLGISINMWVVGSKMLPLEMMFLHNLLRPF